MPNAKSDFDCLPEDILKQHIFPKLYNSSLCIFGRTNKQFHKLTKPFLIPFHLILINSIQDKKNIILYNKSSYYEMQTYLYKKTDKNQQQQLENEKIINDLISAEITIKDIYTISGSIIIQTSNDQLYVKGDNHFGQLGLGHREKQLRFIRLAALEDKGEIKQIQTSRFHTAVLMQNNDLYTCGFNSRGQLGLNNPNNYIVDFTKISSLPSQSKPALVQLGEHSTFVCMEDKTIYAVGYNQYGQLGLGHTEQPTDFVKIDSLSGKGKVLQIQASQSHTLILMDTGVVYVAGRNDQGQLGLGHTLDQHQFIELSILKSIGKVTQIQASGAINVSGANNASSAVLMEDGSVYTAGSNKDGKLGLSKSITQMCFEKVALPEGTVIKEIQLTEESTALIDQYNNVFFTEKMQEYFSSNPSQASGFFSALMNLNNNQAPFSAVFLSSYIKALQVEHEQGNTQVSFELAVFNRLRKQHSSAPISLLKAIDEIRLAEGKKEDAEKLKADLLQNKDGYFKKLLSALHLDEEGNEAMQIKRSTKSLLKP